MFKNVQSYLHAYFTGIRSTDRNPWLSWGMVALRFVVIGISGYYLYSTIFANSQLKEVWASLGNALHSNTSILLFAATLLLLVCNWGLEAFKWKLLLSRFQQMGLGRSFMAILAGTSVSLWVPNRAGEYLGRVFFLKPTARVKGILANIIGSISQLIVTLIMGLMGLLVYSYTRVGAYYIWAGIFILVVAFMVLLLLFYFNLNNIRHLLPRKKWARPARRYLLIYSLYNLADLRRVLFISLARYLVFCTQFYLLLLLFDVHVPIFHALTGIFLMYLVQTVSPTGFFTELMVRGSVSTFLFSAYTAAPLSIPAASYSLWLINLLIPAMAGMLLLAVARIQRNVRY